jgi:hypothetical protein
MAEYQLTIIKRTPNPEWKPTVTRSYYDQLEPPPQYFEVRMLDVTVDEATFAAIRKAAVETL